MILWILVLPINKSVTAPGFKGHVASNGYISIEPANYTRSKSGSSGIWQLLPTYDCKLPGMHMLPVTGPSKTVASAPSLDHECIAFTAVNAASLTCTLGQQ